MPYKGAVCTIDGALVLFVQDHDGSITDGRALSDHESIYATLSPASISFVSVTFRDGTTEVELDQCEDDPDAFPNFMIRDIFTTTIRDRNDEKDIPITQIFHDGDLLELLRANFEDENEWAPISSGG